MSFSSLSSGGTSSTFDGLDAASAGSNVQPSGMLSAVSSCGSVSSSVEGRHSVASNASSVERGAMSGVLSTAHLHFLSPIVSGDLGA